MDNFYDHAAGDWVTGRTRFEAVLAEPRFAPLAENYGAALAPGRRWQLILDLLTAVPEDVAHQVGALVEAFLREHAREFIDQIAAELSRNPRLVSAAREMYLDPGDLDPAIEARLAAAIGPLF